MSGNDDLHAKRYSVVYFVHYRQPTNRFVAFLVSPQTLSIRIFFAGGIAGAVSRTLTAPLDRIKVLMQASHGDHTLNIVSATRKIYV